MRQSKYSDEGYFYCDIILLQPVFNGRGIEPVYPCENADGQMSGILGFVLCFFFFFVKYLYRLLKCLVNSESLHLCGKGIQENLLLDICLQEITDCMGHFHFSGALGNILHMQFSSSVKEENMLQQLKQSQYSIKTIDS